MRAEERREKQVFSLLNPYRKYVKAAMIFCAVFGLLLVAGMVACLCTREWAGASVCGGVVLFFWAIYLLIYFSLSYRRIEFYPDRVVFWHEQAWAWPKMEARYEDIRGACINLSNEEGDHVRARGKAFDYDADTLCVYCEKGEYILFGIQGWGKEYSRRILDEILRRADVPESEPEQGEYGGRSRAAEEGFAELGVEEEPQPADDPEENRFDIEATVGCELYTENGIRVGKIVQVLPAKTDIYIVERNGGKIRLSAEEGLILGMDAENKRMIVDAEKFFAAADERE